MRRVDGAISNVCSISCLVRSQRMNRGSIAEGRKSNWRFYRPENNMENLSLGPPSEWSVVQQHAGIVDWNYHRSVRTVFPEKRDDHRFINWPFTALENKMSCFNKMAFGVHSDWNRIGFNPTSPKILGDWESGYTARPSFRSSTTFNDLWNHLKS